VTYTTSSADGTVTVLDPASPSTPLRSGKHWITHWDPENEQFWESTGKRIARKNLWFSVFAEHIGFSIWVLWTIIVINLGNAGITLTLSQQFWLTAVPNLVGSALRIPYTFAIPRFGGRLWTAISAALLLIPTLLLAFLVPSGWLLHQPHGTQFWVLLACAATAGFGGGNFSSSMANISFFYPEGKKGLALGLNAAGGNLGVAVAQLFMPLVLIIGVPAAAVKLTKHQVHLSYAGLVWLPLIVLAASFAWFKMDSLSQAKTDKKAYVRAMTSKQTWLMSVLYIGTFGSFIGYSFALPLVIKNTFPEFLAHHVFIATYLAGLGFIGALIGSVARPFGGWLSDRLGGARVTIVCFLGMGIATLIAISAVKNHSFPVFFGAFMVIFLLSGMGNGSTYRMIPAIFAALGRSHAAGDGDEPKRIALDYKRQAAAVLGIAGAIGAFGGFLIQVAFRESSLHVSALVKAAKGKTPQETLDAKLAVAQAHADWSVSALWVFFAAYIVLAAITWFCYLRRSLLTNKFPSMASASI